SATKFGDPTSGPYELNYWERLALSVRHHLGGKAMAAPAAATDFLDMLKKSKLVEETRIDDYFHNSHASLAHSPKELAAQLVRDGLLTTFQADQLLHGKYRGFDLG